MIQDILPSVFDNHFSNYSVGDDDIVFLFWNEQVYVSYDSKNQKLILPTFKDFCCPGLSSTYLFSIDNHKYFLITEGIAPITNMAGYSFFSPRQLRDMPLDSNVDLFAVFSAYHIWKWYNDNQFCGHCGNKLEKDTVERALFCPECQAKIYPRINPAVIIGIINGDKLLITKYRKGYSHSALVAGFTEFGETLEQTVEREVMEEVGLKVKNIRYYKSQPWALAQDILAGFFCEVDGDDTIKMDEGELKYAEWVSRKDIELQPSDYSLTNEMMRMFRDGIIR